MRRPPEVWERVFFTLGLAVVLATLIGVVTLERPGSDVSLSTAATVYRFVDPEQQLVLHLLIPAIPPAGTCMVFLPDGDLEFVTSCGCTEAPRPL